ncbi:MAG: membrane protein insertase YidC [Bacteroidales bacterium]|nr:membrane protein insertase YidC [Bacteroidales bacterium]
MDKNTITGTILIGLLIIGFYYFTQPTAEEREQMIRYQDSIREVYQETMRYEKELQQKELQQKENQQAVLSALPTSSHDSIQEQALLQTYGKFAHATNGEEEFTTIENDILSVSLSNKGGKLYSAELKEYKTYTQEPLILLGEDTEFGILLSEIGMSTNELFFTKMDSKTAGKTIPKNTVLYRLYADDYSYIEFEYTLPEDSYQLEMKMNMKGMDTHMRDITYNIAWETTGKTLEKTKSAEELYTNIIWKYLDDDVDNINSRSKKAETKDLTGKVSWVAYKQHFFSVVFIAKNSFARGGEVSLNPITNDESKLKEFSSLLTVERDRNAKEETIEFSFYIGPNHYATLKKQGIALENLLDLGWFGFITKFVIIPIFNWLASFIGNYGLIILLLTILIKIILFPLTFKSYLSTARMRVLKPQIDKINAKFPDSADAMKRQQATMDLYRKAGVNPMGGCLPMLIQFPILIAMFRFFPSSIELRQQSFLWADDLSSFDSILEWTTHIPLLSNFYGNHISLFTLLMAVSMIFVNKFNGANTTPTPGMPNMKVMMWMMSIMMVFWFNNYSSGLSYYYFLANLITILQTIVIRQLINDKAILQKIESNKKSPKKKSGFQERLAKMAREQQNYKR